MSKVPPYETEVFRRVYNNEYGCYYQIGPDADSIGCVEVRYIVEKGKMHPEQMPMCSPECAVLIGQAMIDCAKELQAKEAK